LPSSSSSIQIPALSCSLTTAEVNFRLFVSDVSIRFPSCSWSEVASAVTMPVEILREKCKNGASKVGPKKSMLRFVLNIRK
ncbi:hypothetical protein PFISCL1PPCAC_13934, partial [Pristionchus fissidentatus]